MAPRLRRGPAESIPGLLRSTLTAELALAALVLVVSVALTLVLRDAHASEDRLRDVRAAIRDVRGEAARAEAGIHGYALAPRDAFRQPYVDALPVIERRLDDLDRQTSVDDRITVGVIRDVLHEWRDQFAEKVIGHVALNETDLARQLVESGEGKRRSDQIWALLDQLQTTVTDDAASAEDRIDAATWGVLASGIVLTGGLAALASRTYRRLKVATAAGSEQLD
jgi:CHASE3 domain sensor protein